MSEIENSPQPPTVFDSDQQQLGETYAKALLGLGGETGQVDAYVDSIAGIAEVVEGLPKLKAVLDSPQVSFADKSNMLNKAFGDKVDKNVLNFLKVLTRNGRFDCIAAVAKSAKQLQDEAAGRVQGVLTTATEVDGDVVKRIGERLSQVVGREVRLTAKVDASVIGGMVVRIGDTVYDASVVSQLAQVRSKAIRKAADAIREKLDRFASST